ncbi:cyclohexanone monooxygenase [Coniophora puteana RWD-64-598 SS2]|uniref:Cyclohexanone monooxygenase n=1 Tax=Coniophora puteana (strain RWD-64-598) TaxID=741705 RepID=A0A5M3MH08_CONPW|nr:cyclohexanone monooxygenase [Coniophora puteana RWD-64-598 SS2]EIW77915.1 cyclohexanone monooxygenase [Coniophora puteana RWD-64-598 SS2]
MWSLFRLVESGFRCKLIEAGSDFGGTWYWNRYPGARVDTDVPSYEFELEELWKDWNWPEVFPGGEDLRAYFKSVGQKLDLRRHCLFDHAVRSAHWGEISHLWNVTADGAAGVYEASSRHVIFALGTSAQPYIPNIKGLDRFSGHCMHTARWPRDGLETRGKRVGIIGTGASGVQVIQEVGPVAEKLTVFQRTPNLAIPMRQRALQVQEQTSAKSSYPDIFNNRHGTFTGFSYDFNPRKTEEDTPEQREAFWEGLWSLGGFRFFVGGYHDLFFSKEANDLAYAFWRKKVSERIRDPKKRDLLAPAISPHPFGAKRVSLEQNYWEVVCQDNVDIVDVNNDPIVEVTATGVRTAKRTYDLDILVLATGFDAYTGSYLQIDIRGEEGRTIQEHWREGVRSYLGTTVNKFPNLWFMYGPHSPGAFSVMPALAEVQGGWIVDAMKQLRAENVTKFVARTNAAEAYSQHVRELAPPLLLQAKSWYLGANIPGKVQGIHDYFGGVPAYIQELKEEAEKGYPNFQRARLADSHKGEEVRAKL